MKFLKILVTTSILASSLLAIEPIAKESGWSGIVLMGAGSIKYKNNEIAGNRLLDVENKSISNYGSPESQSTAFPLLTGNAKYTLQDKKTEIFIGNSLEDYLRMDSSLSLGIRHSYKDIGIIGVRILASVTPTDVWEDPFYKGGDRTDTQRTSAGIGLKWESILGSNFEVDVRARNIDFDNDKNGAYLVNNGLAGTSTGDNGSLYISDTQQKLLKRDGTLASTEILYTYVVKKSNIIIPSIKFINDDRDGNARDNVRTDIKLSYFYMSKKFVVATNIFLGSSSYDENNPIFNKKQDTDFIGGGVNITYKNIFNSPNWNLNAGVYASKGDSDIDFYDTSIFMATIGMAYRF